MSGVSEESLINPFKIDGPAIISFSGGRTSAYLVHQILRAHGGMLPENIHVAFANTGKERPETLRFVHECASRWGIRVNWLEWRDGKPSFCFVGFNSASRNGEPFSALIRKKSFLPNWQARFCTQYLKVTPLNAFAESLGFVKGQYLEVIGLRYDEGLRIMKGLANADKFGRTCAYPLSKARVTKRDIADFWQAQSFDLGLQSWDGNCDLCFLKGRRLRKRIIRDNPPSADWWIEQEAATGGSFDRRDRFSALKDEVFKSPELFEDIDAEEYDVECGTYCGEEEQP